MLMIFPFSLRYRYSSADICAGYSAGLFDYRGFIIDDIDVKMNGSILPYYLQALRRTPGRTRTHHNRHRRRSHIQGSPLSEGYASLPLRHQVRFRRDWCRTYGSHRNPALEILYNFPSVHAASSHRRCIDETSCRSAWRPNSRVSCRNVPLIAPV